MKPGQHFVVNSRMIRSQIFKVLGVGESKRCINVQGI
jgi:hypothetical protein